MTPSVFLAGVLTFLWPHARGAAMLIPLALIYGASSGAFVGLIAAPLIPLGDSADVGRRVGMFLTILSIGALAGPPISGAVAHATDGYNAVGLYAGARPFHHFTCFVPIRSFFFSLHFSGSSVMVAVMLLVLSRYLILGRWRGIA
jgi:hypothetical protein